VGSNPTLSGLGSPQPRMVAGFLMRHREVGFFAKNLPVAENRGELMVEQLPGRI